MIAGSGSVLAAETIGFSTTGADREVRFETVSDADAYLGLAADGVAADGLLFEGDPRRPPATFDVHNRLPEPIAITIAVDDVRFVSADGVPVSGDRIVVGEDERDRLGPGERLENVTVGLPRDTERTADVVTGAIRIDADGEATRIDVEREITLERPDVTVEAARLDAYRTDDGRFEHEWSLRDVDTDGVALEGLRFDYSGVDAGGALDFTETDGPSVSVAVDDGEYAGSIERRRPTRLEVALESPIAVESEPIEIVLTNTGPPASPGGGRESPSGATLELVGHGVSTRVEGGWRRP
ncbi:hypothetical protein SAMN04489841_3271 [Natrinema salaciae]|uniref:Uncharacterized protein n=2 Tax=Natrinema salaciae TaxID=1186196 RepID=A0A1H9M9V7_9EURY|nr:hypothetical protein SAMN04489841_3271 [Natrinema salaciae]